MLRALIDCQYVMRRRVAEDGAAPPYVLFVRADRIRLWLHLGIAEGKTVDDDLLGRCRMVFRVDGDLAIRTCADEITRARVICHVDALRIGHDRELPAHRNAARIVERTPVKGRRHAVRDLQHGSCRACRILVVMEVHRSEILDIADCGIAVDV